MVPHTRLGKKCYPKIAQPEVNTEIPQNCISQYAGTTIHQHRMVLGCVDTHRVGGLTLSVKGLLVSFFLRLLNLTARIDTFSDPLIIPK